jgi:phosphoribosyl 1,2-cyclic phosphodiesterase
VRFALLASGSGGNSLIMEHRGYSLLVDAGMSFRETHSRMVSAGMADVRPSALLLTHEHSDHSCGAGVLARKYRIPVYATPGTARSAVRSLGKVPAVVPFENGTRIELGPFLVSAQRLPHDAEDPSGYVIEWNDGRLGVATDLGSWGEWLVAGFRGCTALVMEFNHDLGMLWEGSYPWHLKQRIASSSGHLCNADAASLLERLRHPGLERVVLAHLSRENNTPDMAFRAAKGIFGTGGSITVGDQFESTPVMEL